MSAVPSATEHFADLFERVADRLPARGLAGLDDLRRAALARFRETGLPTTRDEDWRYTNLAPVARGGFEPAGEPAIGGGDAGAAERLALGGPDWPRAVFVDGRFAPGLSRLQGLEAGLEVVPLAEGAARWPGWVSDRLGPDARPGAAPLAALNAALWDDGLAVRVREGARCERPLEVIFVASERCAGRVFQPRLLVEAGAGSGLRIVESWGGGEAEHFANAVTRATLAPGARLAHHKVLRGCAGALHLSRLDARLAADSVLHGHATLLGGRLVRNDIAVHLDEPGARCELDGLMVGATREHHDTHTRIEHLAPRATSREHYKGVFGGRSRGVFDGRVVVHEGAIGSDAEQSSRNLLLSREAEVDVKPQLEIYNDDVKCSHGATVGQLDERMLFYLRARGIGEETARGLLVYGFARDVLERIGDPETAQALAGALLECLPDAERLREVLS